jgi:tetratricopeptide (TPR) repeat protein
LFIFVGGDINTVKEYFMNAKEYIERAEIKYFRENNFDGAIADLTEAIRLEPDNPFTYCRRGMIYRRKNELDTAIADFTKAIQLEPKEGSFYFERGGTYIFKENNTLAVSDLEMAVKLDPQNTDYREALGEIKRLLNQ